MSELEPVGVQCGCPVGGLVGVNLSDSQLSAQFHAYQQESY